jgi:SAM-dependent methyltransferase
MASLTLAEEFRRRNALNRARFVQMNLFQPCFANETFHAIISNGVLHHTGNPAGGIARLAQLLKPGGYLIIGLYHRFGRLATDARRTIFRLTGERMRFLDRRAVSRDLGDKRQEAWFNDQYRNPHESKHTISEAATFFEKAGLKVLRSLPSRSWSPDPGDNLFEEEPISGRATFAKEITFALRPSQIAEGGFFVLVGQRQ